MPQDVTIPQPEHVNLDDQRFELVRELIDSREAISLVNQTFDRYSLWRTRNQDPRWMDNDRLYHGYIPKRYWPGTKVERSSIPVQIAFDQVESLYPIIYNEVFGQSPYWFSVGSTLESTPEEAFQLQAALAFQLDTPWTRNGISAKQHLGLALRQYLQNGNGAVEIGWDPRFNGLMVEWTNLRDLFLDPATSFPWIDSSPAVVKRKMVTVAELVSYRDIGEYKVPSDNFLYTLTKSNASDPSQQGKKEQASLVGEDGATSEIQPVNPSDRRIELLIYWSNRRLIWVLGRKWAMLNVPNPYGFIPFCMAPLYPVLGRIYAQSIPDVVEGDQKLIQGIVNARIDELSLALHPPRIRARNLSEPSSQLVKWGPGVEITVDSPDQVDVKVPENVTREAYIEVSAAERRVEKRTGASQLVQTGTPTPSNANRTRGGVGAQQQASNTRVSSLVENFEDYLIVPFLYKAQKILAEFTPEDQVVAGLDQNGQIGQVPRESLNARVRFKMDSARRMVSRERLEQTILPVTQTLFNEAVLGMLQSQGKTVNMDEWTRMFEMATGTHEHFNLIVPMTPEQQEAAQQPSPEVLADMQAKQLEAQTRLQMGQVKAQTEMAKAQIEAQSKGDETAEKSGREILKVITGDQSQRDVNRQKHLVSLLQSVIQARSQDKKQSQTNNKK